MAEITCFFCTTSDEHHLEAEVKIVGQQKGLLEADVPVKKK